MNKKIIYESQIEKNVLEKLYQELAGTELKIIRNDKWITQKFIRLFDVALYKSNNPFALFEINSFHFDNGLFKAKEHIRTGMEVSNARFGIITNGDKFFLFDNISNNKDFVEISFSSLIQKLTSINEIKLTKTDKLKILEVFKSSALKHLSSNKEVLDFILNNKLTHRLKFDNLRNTVYLNDRVKTINSFENIFFNKLFGTFSDKKICRYTSLDTLFQMLNNLSVRMNGLVGMNDRSEINYVDNYLNGNEKPLSRMHHNTIIALNKRYITSCSKITRKDELTLWRLYAEDGTGVCLVFDIKKENLNENILIQKVKYADENGIHPELEFLKEIKTKVKLITNYTFEFRNIGLWKHFFKPYDYSVEEEVRVLVIDNNKLDSIALHWVKTYSHSIINPCIDFRLNSPEFPVHLSQIILGPKLPEQESNLVQFQEMVRRKKREIAENKISTKLDRLKITQSKIKSYR